MSELQLPLSGLRVVDCTVDRGELAGRLLGDLGADVIKVEPPGGSPARATAPVRRGVSLAFAVRNAGKRGVVLDLTVAADVERFHDLLDHADVLVTSDVEVDGIDTRTLVARHPHLVVGAITAFGIDGPYADWIATDAALAATRRLRVQGGHPRRLAAVAAGPPGRRRGVDHQRLRVAVRALPARTDRRRPIRRDLGERGDRADLRLVAAELDGARSPRASPAGEVRNGNGPVYPIFACKGGYVRLVILSVRQWHAMREWLGEPEYLQDPDARQLRRPARDRRARAQPAARGALRRPEHGGGVGSRRRSAGSCARPALTPARHAHQRAPRVARHVRRLRDRARCHRAASRPGSSRSTVDRAGPRTSAAGVGEHTDAGLRRVGRRARTATDAAPVAGPPLAGLRVMDFGHGAVGVEVGRRFAEYGAEVIKIESRTYPDFMRLRLGRRDQPVVRVVEPFEARLRCQRQVARRARRSCSGWPAQSDVVIENNSTGTMDKLGHRLRRPRTR